MNNTNASADAEISAQGEQKKEEKKPPKVITGTVKGTIEDIYDGTTTDGSRYIVVHIAGKKISAFDDRLKQFSIGDFVEIQYRQKGIFLNLVSINKIETNSKMNPQTNLVLEQKKEQQNSLPEKESPQNKTQLSASVKFAENFPERISFRDGAVHFLKIISDEEAEIIDNATGSTKKGIRYFVEENGKKKEFFTTSTQLILTMAKFSPGDTIQIQLKHKVVAGRVRSYYDIIKIS